MNKGFYPGHNSGPILPFEPQGGHVIPAARTFPIPDFANLVAVTLGGGVIQRLPPWPAYSAAVVLVFKAAVLLVHSSYLVLPTAENIQTAVDDMALAVPLGDGRWSLKYGFSADAVPWSAYFPTLGSVSGTLGAGNTVVGLYKKYSATSIDMTLTVSCVDNGTAAGGLVVPLHSGFTTTLYTAFAGIRPTTGVGYNGYAYGSSLTFFRYDGTHPGTGTFLLSGKLTALS